MTSIKVWDPFIRIFHWVTVFIFFANFTVFEDGGSEHNYAGYILLALLTLRIIWGFAGSKDARFKTFWPSFTDIKEHISGFLSADTAVHLSHNPLGAVMVFNLIITLFLICITGIMMTDGGWSNSSLLESSHELLSIYALFCVGLHVVGVLFETKRSKINLLKAMITGRKTLPSEEKSSP